MEQTFKAGSIALVGAPNAGKSTLLNQVLGQKVAAVSPKPQTTRNRVAGILTRPGFQAVLIDTPGIHDPEKSRSPMNRALVTIAEATLDEVDAVCWVVDAARAATRAAVVGEQGDEGEAKPIVTGILTEIAGRLSELGVPVIVALNKIDRVEKRWLLPVIQAFHTALPEASILPISAAEGQGIEPLLAALTEALPEGEASYPDDQLLIDSERFVVAELIREQIFRLTEEEIPYATAVEIEKFDESQREEPGPGKRRPEVEIFARIVVERSSQKGILIGRRGEMLKQIGTRSRAEIEALLGCHVYLHLHVAVERDWSHDPRFLKRMGL